MKTPNLILAAFVLLSACAMGPDYERPSTPTPTAYKEWKPAAPQDEVERGPWWMLYHDATLNHLQAQVATANQNLKAAEAAARQAEAAAKESRAAFFPTLGLNGATARTSGMMPVSSLADSLYGAASWTPDLWGRIRRSAESGQASAEASKADQASMLLSLQSLMASTYFALRAQDESLRLMAAGVEAAAQRQRLAQSRFDSGVGDAAELFAARSRTDNAKAQLSAAKAKRSQLEHAIAVLIGKPPADFTLPAVAFRDSFDAFPPGLPSALLERRPDIAAAERRVMAANAQIGMAQTAWFPDLTLSASGGYASSALSTLLQSSSSFWSIGPSLALSLLDGGAREAKLEQASAAYDQSVATYRQTALSAFQQVEDGLALMRYLSEQRDFAQAALQSSKNAENLAQLNYLRGVGSFDAKLAALSERLEAEQNLLAVRAARLDASIALIQALGGGF